MSTSPVKPGDLVEIQWLDAESTYGGWVEHYRIEPRVLKAFGLFRDMDEYFVYYSDCYDPGTEKWSGNGAIPRKMVLGMEVIRAGAVEV